MKLFLSDRRDVADGTMGFWLKLERPMRFIAGQFGDFTLIDPPYTDKKGITRTFSFASAPGTGRILIATRMRDSAFKRTLATVPIGMPVQLMGPMGSFTLHKDSARPAVFLTGRIGITPVRSIVEEATQQKRLHSSPEVIRLAVMMYIRYPLSLRQVEDLLFERGIDICHETVRFWWNRFGPLFAAEIRKRRVHSSSYSQWRWHLDEVFVKINGETHFLWRAVGHEGEVLEAFATKRRDRRAALKFLKRTMKRYGRPRSIVTDRLRSYAAALRGIGISERHECGRWLNNRAENSHQPFRPRERAMAKFRSIETIQKFASVHASIHNHFNQDRHLICRDIFKQNRSAALAEWRQLAT